MLDAFKKELDKYGKSLEDLFLDSSHLWGMIHGEDVIIDGPIGWYIKKYEVARDLYKKYNSDPGRNSNSADEVEDRYLREFFNVYLSKYGEEKVLEYTISILIYGSVFYMFDENDPKYGPWSYGNEAWIKGEIKNNIPYLLDLLDKISTKHLDWIEGHYDFEWITEDELYVNLKNKWIGKKITSKSFDSIYKEIKGIS